MESPIGQVKPAVHREEEAFCYWCLSTVTGYLALWGIWPCRCDLEADVSEGDGGEEDDGGRLAARQVRGAELEVGCVAQTEGAGGRTVMTW